MAYFHCRSSWLHRCLRQVAEILWVSDIQYISTLVLLIYCTYRSEYEELEKACKYQLGVLIANSLYWYAICSSLQRTWIDK